MSGVVVLGSANLDLFAAVPVIPSPGETVLAEGPQRRPGGKGLNQAVASAAGGAPTRLLGAVGDDDAADVLLAAANEAGVDVTLVRREAGASGTAWITVQPDGENAIVVLGAANRTLTELSDAERAAIADADVLVTQLETPVPAVRAAAEAARGSGTLVVLNASPAQHLEPAHLALVDVLVVNEHELRALAGGSDVEGSARSLLVTVGSVVVTLGADGVVLADATGVRRVPAIAARVVDTTGAGDTFAGVLAAGLADGMSLDAAAGRAVVAGALAVETLGAQPSISGALIDERLRQVEAR